MPTARVETPSDAWALPASERMIWRHRFFFKLCLGSPSFVGLFHVLRAQLVAESLIVGIKYSACVHPVVGFWYAKQELVHRAQCFVCASASSRCKKVTQLHAVRIYMVDTVIPTTL